MASRARFPVYHGEKPYIFISYAHADSARVLPIAEALHKRFYRVWYDEGIDGGAHWADFIAEHLEGAAIVLYFPSIHFNSNRNCEREVNYAVEAKTDMACVRLDDARMPSGLKMQLLTATTIYASADPVETVDRLLQSGALGAHLIGDGKEGYKPIINEPEKPINFSLIFGAIGVALAVFFGVALLGYTRGCFGDQSGLRQETVTISPESGAEDITNVQITTWTSAVMRDLLISQTSGEALYCCGNAFVAARGAIDYQDGAFLVGGAPVARGDISDLDTIADLTDLVELSLCYESITDISALSALQKLIYLDLSGNEITDIASISGLNQLATLKLAHTGVTDLTPVLSMAGLNKLYISYDMIPNAEPILSGSFDLIITE